VINNQPDRSLTTKTGPFNLLPTLLNLSTDAAATAHTRCK
jgi:hypothetical protein